MALLHHKTEVRQWSALIGVCVLHTRGWKLDDDVDEMASGYPHLRGARSPVLPATQRTLSNLRGEGDGAKFAYSPRKRRTVSSSSRTRASASAKVGMCLPVLGSYQPS